MIALKEILGGSHASCCICRGARTRASHIDTKVNPFSLVASISVYPSGTRAYFNHHSLLKPRRVAQVLSLSTTTTTAILNTTTTTHRRPLPSSPSLLTTMAQHASQSMRIQMTATQAPQVSVDQGPRVVVLLLTITTGLFPLPPLLSPSSANTVGAVSATARTGSSHVLLTMHDPGTCGSQGRRPSIRRYIIHVVARTGRRYLGSHNVHSTRYVALDRTSRSLAV